MKTLFFFTYCFVSLISFGWAQGDFSYQHGYRENILLDQDIVSGGYYVDPSKNIEGHPYFESRNFENGEIKINGLIYKEVPLLYDIWNDEILTFQPVHKKKILVRADKVQEFAIGEKDPKKFIRIADNPGYSHHKNGIYELIVEGKVNLLAKHYKQTKDKRDVSKFSDVFYEKTDYFLKKGADIQLIRKKKQAREFLEMEKKPFKDVFKGQRISFKSERGDYLEKLVEHHNTQRP